jgi:hypothetical protein
VDPVRLEQIDELLGEHLHFRVPVIGDKEMHDRRPRRCRRRRKGAQARRLHQEKALRDGRSGSRGRIGSQPSC